jgi:hypothetical protein
MPPSPADREQAFARRRGGQRGNHNAIKHGFYAQQFNPTDLKDLEKCELTGLSDEIAMLRVQARRVFGLSGQAQDLNEAILTLRALSLAAYTINRLIRTQLSSGMQHNEVQDALKQALLEIGEEMDAGTYPGGPVAPNLSTFTPTN